ELGGWVGRFGPMYPHERMGSKLIATLVAQVHERPSITVFTQAELVSKAGSFGNYRAGIRVRGEAIELEVGSIVVATGFETYQPEAGEFGYGIDGVVTLPEFKSLVDGATGPLVHHGRPVRDIVYVYCVGSRPDGVPDGNAYCSRYCCTAAVHASLQVAGLHRRAAAASGSEAPVHQYHLVRDVRTYGDYELLYEESRKRGSVFVKFADDAPPAVALDDAGNMTVTVKDLLTAGEEIAIPADLVVLVTGMIPRPNEELIAALKVPKSRDGFFNEIHPKLRPVETVVDGVLIAGACQAPRNSAESVGSGLAAVTQSAAILKKGVAELDPLVATVNPDGCTWCGACLEACPFAAVEKVVVGDREVAAISEAGCKGCGGCVPACPSDAIDLRGYTSGQITAMIDRLVEVPA
ncbi:MAG: 4Fe-4S dicluster domain-containing protein, partial [Candidatus Limnocylindria bacterium]